MSGKQIVVGYDGSPPARAAVAWAVDEGVRCDLPVRLVRVLGRDRPADDPHRGVEAELKRLAADLDDWGALGVPVTAAVVEGAAANMLCEQSGEAALLVVGDRGHGGFTGLRVGSVSLTVATYAQCPVVVVRGTAGVPSSRPVAVGTDGSPHGELALQHAFAEAAARAVGLLVVRAYGPEDGPEVGVRARLDKQLDAFRDRHPGVPVATRLTRATPGHALMVASHDAQLIVAGAKGRGGLANLVLGSAAQQLIQYALCAVMVVRGTPDPFWNPPIRAADGPGRRGPSPLPVAARRCLASTVERRNRVGGETP